MNAVSRQLCGTIRCALRGQLLVVAFGHALLHMLPALREEGADEPGAVASRSRRRRGVRGIRSR